MWQQEKRIATNPTLKRGKCAVFTRLHKTNTLRVILGFSRQRVGRWLSAALQRPLVWQKFTEEAELLASSIIRAIIAIMMQAVSKSFLSLVN
jgi:hypothetical protein